MKHRLGITARGDRRLGSCIHLAPRLDALKKALGEHRGVLCYKYLAVVGVTLTRHGYLPEVVPMYHILPESVTAWLPFLLQPRSPNRRV